jgi:choline dehydrogenase-like flavoprotein
MSEHYDVIIIGTGAGGGTLAHRLAPTGKRILLLERGGYLPREPENWDSEQVFLKERYLSGEEWIDRDGNPFRPHQQYFVGGNTKFYGAILFRLRKGDFGEVRHWAGTSPAWPIDYEDLEPYYAQAEERYLVHGQAGEDPTEPERSGPFPYAAVSHEPRIQQLSDDFARTGHQPFHLPVGVDLNESDPEAGNCVRCDRFDGFPCLTDGKADAHVRCVRPALEHPNVTLRRHAKVERLETNASGREVTSVVVDRKGVEERYSADVVVVSCGAVNSAALLMRSANDAHPRGLANSSDVVGRHYMAHINSGVIAISKEPNPTKFQKTLGVNDYYDPPTRASDFEYPLGHIQMLGKSDRSILRGGAPWFAPGIALDFLAKHAIDFWLTTEDLPHPSNRVTVDRQGRIHLAKVDHNTEPHKRLLQKLKGLMGHIGCETMVPGWSVLDQRIPLAGVAHQSGTVRFGTDPQTSALDVHCRAHDVANLYVVDTSFFPSSSAVNPALTAMANAMRVGDHLIERLGSTVPTGVEVTA